MNIFSVDLGFVQTKAVSKKWKTKFSSLTKKTPSTDIDAFADSDGYAISCAGKNWRVGTKGSYDFTSERMSSENDIIKLLTAIALQGKTTQGIDLLITGLPIEEYNAYRDTLKDSLYKKQFTYRFAKQTKDSLVQLNDVLVIPQSVGAFYDMILDDQGEVINEEMASEVILTLDIGGRTTDGCIMEAGRFNQDSFTIFKGVWKLHEQVRRLVLKEFKYVLQPYEVDAVVRARAIKLGSEVTPCGHLIKEAVELIFPALQDELTLYIGDFRRISGVILTGGGAHLYKGMFQDLFSSKNINMMVSEDAEFANAQGYYKYGLLKTKAEQE